MGYDFSAYEFKENARDAMRGNMGKANFAWIMPGLIIAVLMALLIVFIPAGQRAAGLLVQPDAVSEEQFAKALNLFSTATSLLSVLFAFITLGSKAMFIRMIQGKECGFKTLFSLFGSWAQAAALALINQAFIYAPIFLGNAFASIPLLGMLFQMAGMVASLYLSFKLAMAEYVLADCDGKNVLRAIAASWKMMDSGNIARFIWLKLSFFGWIILLLLTSGLASFYVMPYMELSTASFYEHIKAKAGREQV